MIVERIISGGQTGADRGGLEAAIALEIPHGGYCPKGRRSEDGRVPRKYELIETSTPYYPERTRMNVQESDATVLFAWKPSSGSAVTLDAARMMAKPIVIIDPREEAAAAKQLVRWLKSVKPKTLNVAGHREASSPGIEGQVKRIVGAAISTITPMTERRAAR